MRFRTDHYKEASDEGSKKVHYLFDQPEHSEQFEQNSPEQTGDLWWILKSTGESSSKLEL
jgi:hypothetical protein